MKIREVTSDDLAAVSALTVAEGWAPFDKQRWLIHWQTNPAVLHDSRPVQRGWVVEEDDSIVGFIGNVVQRYCWKGKIVRVASAAAFVVDPAARAGLTAFSLARAFTNQPNVEMLQTSTASVHAQKILEACNFQKIPVPNYDEDEFWIVRCRGLAEKALRNRGVPAVIAKLLGIACTPLLWFKSRIRKPQLCNSVEKRFVVESGSVQDIDDEFDGLWRQVNDENARLLSVRDAETLRWHFSACNQNQPPTFVMARNAVGELIGYLLLRRKDRDGLRCWQIVDLLIRDDNADVCRLLLNAACEKATKDRAHVLDVTGVPIQIRRLSSGSVASRKSRSAAWPYLFKCADAKFLTEVSSSEVWHPTLLDGDACLDFPGASVIAKGD